MPIQYTNKAGAKRFRPTPNEAVDAARDDGNDGFCIGCGELQAGVEPDARKYECESYKACLEYGFDELFLMGLVY